MSLLVQPMEENLRYVNIDNTVFGILETCIRIATDMVKIKN